MGGDFGPRCIVPACLSAMAENPSLELILVGQAPVLEEILSRQPGVDRARLRVEHASEIIAMDERPAQALRNKPDSPCARRWDWFARGGRRPVSVPVIPVR